MARLAFLLSLLRVLRGYRSCSLSSQLFLYRRYARGVATEEIRISQRGFFAPQSVEVRSYFNLVLSYFGLRNATWFAWRERLGQVGCGSICCSWYCIFSGAGMLCNSGLLPCFPPALICC